MTTTKTSASAAKDEAEAARALAEAEAARAQARLNHAQADEAEAKAQVAAIALAKALEDETARVNSDAHHRLYQFNGAVDAASTRACMAQLRQWDRIDPTCSIEIIFNSPGGGVIDGMALFDLITRLSKRAGGQHHITIGAQGYAASMGGILLQAGDVRWMGKQAYVLVHEISAGTGGKIGDMKDDVKLYENMCKRVTDIFVNRSGGKCSKQTFTKSWTRTDWWLDSDACIKLGFVDEVR